MLSQCVLYLSAILLGLAGALPTDTEPFINGTTSTSPIPVTDSAKATIYFPPSKAGHVIFEGGAVVFRVSESLGPQSADAITCETSGGSPLTGESQAVADALKNSNKVCWQSNSSGSKCTKVANWKSAQVSLCGQNGAGMLCKNVGHVTQAILNKCKRPNGRAGGFANIEDGVLRVALH